MDLQKLTKFFMWYSIINGAILVFAIIGCVLGPDLGLSIQSRLFNIPRATLNVVIHMYLGVFKIVWLIFNVTPYVALRVVGKNA